MSSRFEIATVDTATVHAEIGVEVRDGKPDAGELYRWLFNLLRWHPCGPHHAACDFIVEAVRARWPDGRTYWVEAKTGSGKTQDYGTTDEGDYKDT